LGIRKTEDAEQLVDTWFSTYLSGNRTPQPEEERLSKTVQHVVNAFIDRLVAKLRPKLRQWHRGNPTNHDTYKKYTVLLNKLIAFADKQQLPRIRQLDTDLVFQFQESWQGRRIKNPRTGEFHLNPKSDTAKDREQGLMRKFFAWCLKNKYITEDPCNNLDRITPNESPAKPFSPEEEHRLFGLIADVFPQKHQYVRAFVKLQKFSGCRISAVATAETSQLEDGGIWLRERKTEAHGAPNYV
jgi:site-specific recombinase XerD